MPPQNKENRKRGKKNEVDLDDEEYRKKRDRNNLVCVFIKMMKKIGKWTCAATMCIKLNYSKITFFSICLTNFCLLSRLLRDLEIKQNKKQSRLWIE